MAAILNQILAFQLTAAFLDKCTQDVFLLFVYPMLISFNGKEFLKKIQLMGNILLVHLIFLKKRLR
jgi:hypothetical protein